MTQDSLLELSVERMAYGADAIAHTPEGKTVFVSGAVAGDVVLAKLVSEGDSFARAKAEKIVEPSPNRVTPPCPYASVCGGCPWAVLSRSAQLEAKRSNVVDSLRRIGHMDAARAEELVGPCEAPSDDWGYRNKVEWYVVDRNTDLGLLVSSFNKLGQVRRARLLGYLDALNEGETNDQDAADEKKE